MKLYFKLLFVLVLTSLKVAYSSAATVEHEALSIKKYVLSASHQQDIPQTNDENFNKTEETEEDSSHKFCHVSQVHQLHDFFALLFLLEQNRKFNNHPSLGLISPKHLFMLFRNLRL